LILSFGLLFLFAVMYDDYQSLFGEYLSEVFRPANCHCPRTTDHRSPRTHSILK